jgi:hypothetical protein
MFAHRFTLLMVGLSLAACFDHDDDGTPDARRPGTADARPSDARPSDARPSDARPSDGGTGPDAPAAADAAVIDAPLNVPDAAAPDAPLAIDAMPPSGAAKLIINEVAPSGETNDLVELYAVQGGSVNNITLYQNIIADVDLLARLPNVTVQTGDLIVVHLKPATTFVEETTTKAACTADECYDQAWDFHGETGDDHEIGHSQRVVYLLTAPPESWMDAVPFMRTNVTLRNDYIRDLLHITASGPIDNPGVDVWKTLCADPCDTAEKASAASVDWMGAAPAPNGDTVQRKAGAPDTRSKDDWQTGVQPQTLGLPN